MAYETYLALEAELDRLRDQVRSLTARIREEEDRIRLKRERIRQITGAATSPNQMLMLRQLYDELNREHALVNYYRQVLIALLNRMRAVEEQAFKYRRLLVYGGRAGP
jgi:predicted nuclease with TOPRIM domain